MDVKQDTRLRIEPGLPPTAAETDNLSDDIDGDDFATPPSDKFGARASLVPELTDVTTVLVCTTCRRE